jgi:hypothetical protein
MGAVNLYRGRGSCAECPRFHRFSKWGFPHPIRLPSFHSARSGQALPAFLAGGWALARSTTPIRSRLRAAHCDSISTGPLSQLHSEESCSISSPMASRPGLGRPTFSPQGKMSPITKHCENALPDSSRWRGGRDPFGIRLRAGSSTAVDLCAYGAQRSVLAQDDIAEDSPTLTLDGPGFVQCEIPAQIPCFEYLAQIDQKISICTPKRKTSARIQAFDKLSHLAAKSVTGRSVSDPRKCSKQQEMKLPDAYRKEKVAFSTVPKVICNQEARR